MSITKNLAFLLAWPIIVIFIGILGNSRPSNDAENIYRNEPEQHHQSFSFSYPSTPFSEGMPPGLQVVRSLLGLEVKFLNGHLNYAGLDIVKDGRYQALIGQEKLVDAIFFQPLGKTPFLILIAISKNAHGSPIIIPGKFDIVQKTQQNGFVLKDIYGRLFYYSGYVLTMPIWKNLTPGQVLQDKFCKQPIQMAMCSVQDTVSVVLKKAIDFRKDIPLLVLMK